MTNTKKTPRLRPARRKRSGLSMLVKTFAVIGLVVALSSTAINAMAGDEETMLGIAEETNIIELPLVEETYIERYAYEIPYNGKYGGYKSYIDYTAITDKTSKQYAIQKMAVTDNNSFRKVNDRYLISLGSYFNAPIGSYVDILLGNGITINCIVGEIKPDENTDTKYHIWTENNCATAFIVDTHFIDDIAIATGDVSYIFPEWQDCPFRVTVYNKTVFDEIS